MTGLTFTNCPIALLISGPSFISNTTFISNMNVITFSGNSNITILNYSFLFHNSTVLLDTPSLSSNSTISVSHSLFFGNGNINRAKVNGGCIGLRANRTTIISKNNRYINNNAIYGGVSLYSDSGVTTITSIYNSDYYYNNTCTYSSAVHYIGGNVTMRNCIFDSNSVPNTGFGIVGTASFYNIYGELAIINCTFIKNYGGYGSALYISAPRPSILIEGSSFISNKATNGGAIYIFSSSNVNITSNNIIGNYAVSSGGGVYLSQSSKVTISSSIIESNTTVSGGGVYMIRSIGSGIQRRRRRG